jgi:hypothetical protein
MEFQSLMNELAAILVEQYHSYVGGSKEEAELFARRVVTVITGSSLSMARIIEGLRNEVNRVHKGETI